MSDKHGSRRDLRDPETPDTLHERLRAVREERASARASPGTSRETITPAPADRTNMSQPAAGGKSARSSLSFDDDQARQQHEVAPGINLFNMEHSALIEWMVSNGVEQTFIAIMIEMQMDGELFRAFVTDNSGLQIKPDLETQVSAWVGGDAPKTAGMRIAVIIKSAFGKWQEVQENKTKQSSLTFTLKDLQSIVKVPELPAGKGADGRITGEQFKAHCESLHATLNIIHREYSSRIIAIYKSPTFETLECCIVGMTEKSWQIDELVGSSYMKSYEDKTMSTIIAMKRHMSEGRYSGLFITQALGEATTQLTGARLGDLLVRLFEPIQEAPSELRKLESTYKKHKEALTSLTSLDIHLHPVIQCFLLQQMAAKLAAKSEHNLILGIPMASIVKDGFEDLPGMTSMIENAIVEASNDPKSSKPRIRSSLERKLERQIAALTKGESGKVPAADKACVTHREESVLGYHCIEGKNCKFKHERSGKVCTAPEYLKYGRCARYFIDCIDCHPFPDEAKKQYGSPQVGWRALCDTLPTKGKNKNKRGKAYPIFVTDFAEAYLQASYPVGVDRPTISFEPVKSAAASIIEVSEEPEEIDLVSTSPTASNETPASPQIFLNDTGLIYSNPYAEY
jgi:hypothetical protein